MAKQTIAHLSWIRQPIVETVDQARLAMESYVSKKAALDKPPSGVQPVWLANQRESVAESFDKLCRLIEQVHSAITIIESPGALALTQELQVVCSNIRQGLLEDQLQNQALIAVQDGLSMIPPYLKMVGDGAPDTAGILAKYINTIRELRGVPLLSGENLLPANVSFSFIPPPLRIHDASPAVRDAVFAKAGAEFQKGFADYISNQSKEALGRMRKVLIDLVEVTHDIEVGCCWWVGECLLSAIASGGLRGGGTILSNIRVLSVAIQKLSSAGEEGAKQAVGIERFRTLLYSLSLTTRTSPEIIAALEAFGIGGNVENEAVKALQERLVASQAETLDDVVPELKPQLDIAMVSLGRALGTKTAAGFTTQMQAFRVSMRVVSNVFSMINEEELSAVADSILASVHSVEVVSDLNAELIEQLKVQVLYLDQRMESLETNIAGRILQITGISAETISALVVESHREIVGIRQKISLHVESGAEPQTLLAGIERLAATSAAFGFAGGHHIEELLSGVANALVGLVDDGRLADSENLDLAARALVSVEMYFASLNDNLTPTESLLDESAKALQALGIEIGNIKPISKNELIAKFDEAKEVESTVGLAGEDDPLLGEIFELRPPFDTILSNPDIRRRPAYAALYEAATRLAVAAQIADLKPLHKLCAATASLAVFAPNSLDNEEPKPSEVQALARNAVEMIMRCMDEYSSRGVVSLFTKNITGQIIDLIGDVTIEEVNGRQAEALDNEGKVDGQDTTARPYPENIDGELIKLFKQEYVEQHAQIASFCEGGDYTVTENLCRAVHTMNGISGSAGCAVLKAIFEALEQTLFSLVAENKSISPADANRLSNLLAEVTEYQSDFPWTTETNNRDGWIAVASAIGQPELNAIKQASPNQDVSSEATVSVREMMERNNKEFSHAETLEPIKQRQSSKIKHETTIPSDVIVAVPEVESSEPDIEYSLEMASYYLDDAEEVLPQLHINVACWMDDMANTDLVKEIKRAMHTLKGAAGLASAPAISDLTHHMESLFESMSYGNIKPNNDCAELVGMVLATIESMTEAVRAERSYSRPEELIEFVSECVELNAIDLSKFHAAIETSLKSQAAPGSTQKGSDQSKPADTESPQANQALEEPRHAAAEDDQAQEDEAGVDSQTVHDAQHVGEATGRTRRKMRGKRGRGNSGTKPEIQSDATGIDEDQGLEPAVTTVAMTHEVPAIDELGEARTHLVGRMNVEQHDGEDAPINSASVSSMINRLQGQISKQQGLKKKSGNSEKIKVDQRLLETAVEQSSELNASRHRQQAQHEDFMITLTSLREKLSLHLLNQNRFTNALRGYNNQTYTASGKNVVEEEMQLERFTHLSALHVASSVEVELMLQDVEDMFDQGRLIQDSYNQQARLISSLQRDLLDSRLVEFQNIKQALVSVIEQTSKAVKKPIDKAFIGADTIMDKVMLEGIRDPLTHILKNAIDHGIEAPEDRVAAGKEKEGKITVSVARRAKSIVISIADDGRGIDPQLIRSKAIEKGVISPDAEMSDRDLIYLVTQNGFTTSSRLTTISGRGVGMDIVKSSVEAIGGLLRIDSIMGKGTTFTMELPFTIGSNRAMVCQAGNQWFAIPCYTMTQMLECSRVDLDRQRASKGHATIEYDGEAYEVVHLADLIAMPELKSKAHKSTMVTTILCNQGDTRIAVEVDKGGSMPEIHVRKLEGIMAKLKGIIGETEIHDSTAVLVLDVMELARINLKRTESGYKVRLNRIRAIRRDEKPLAMVVDDASSYRKILSKYFEARGFSVILARDGQDAMNMLPLARMPDVIIVDAEMPRLDGFELTKALRGRAEFDNIPIVMLTTRTGLEEKAHKVGVNVFLNKPHDGQVLDNTISSLLPNISLQGVTV